LAGPQQPVSSAVEPPPQQLAATGVLATVTLPQQLCTATPAFTADSPASGELFPPQQLPDSLILRFTAPLQINAKYSHPRTLPK
tara:strand:- start:426 stop:677 length:252 start_codon:yes stop_codon:yes gene_type:complete